MMRGNIVSSFDLRLLISDLDLKVLNSITVSPEPGMGHFSEIGPAIKYAKRFSEARESSQHASQNR